MKSKFVELTEKTQNELMDSHQKKFKFLIKEINILKSSDSHTNKLAAFLLEIQEIEFHLMTLLTELCLVNSLEPDLVHFDTKLFKTKCCGKEIIRIQKDPFDMTLGEKKIELDKYAADFLSLLQEKVSKLNKLRRRYSHHLFSGLDGWEKVKSDVEEGLLINSLIFNELLKISRYIENETKWGKLSNRKIEE